MRTAIYILLIHLWITGCSSSGKSMIETTEVQSEAGKSIQSQDSLIARQRLENILKGLEHNFQNTNYCALIKQEKSTFLMTDDDVDILRVQADVLEVFMGNTGQSIIYEMVVEKGEQIELNTDPIIICLCEVNGELIWPGVGSIFPNEEVVLSAARTLANKYQFSEKNSCTE